MSLPGDCNILAKIKDMMLIGKGVYGKAYLYHEKIEGEDCRCVVKISEIGHETDIERFINNDNYTNSFHKFGLAPEICKTFICSGEVYLCVTIMDYIPGSTAEKLFMTNRMTKDMVDILFERIDELHQHAVHGHGDLNFGNMIYSNEIWMFIDYDYKVVVSDEPPWNDYFSIMTSLDKLIPKDADSHISFKIKNYIYDKIFERYQEYSLDMNVSKQYPTLIPELIKLYNEYINLKLQHGNLTNDDMNLLHELSEEAT